MVPEYMPEEITNKRENLKPIPYKNLTSITTELSERNFVSDDRKAKIDDLPTKQYSVEKS